MNAGLVTLPQKIGVSVILALLWLDQGSGDVTSSLCRWSGYLVGRDPEAAAQDDDEQYVMGWPSR